MITVEAKNGVKERISATSNVRAEASGLGHGQASARGSNHAVMGRMSC